jgi:predicted lipoprotein with Yx(FWY)xxD motif
VAAATVVAAAVLVVSVATSGAASTSPPVKSGTLLEVRTVGGKSVLTNSRGFTLYWFAPDTPTMSKCGASCAAYWPPVTGRPTAGPGVSGALGTIVRGDGVLQATYDRHPLYTYIGDSAPGQANGNGLDLNGGLWHEVAVSG